MGCTASAMGRGAKRTEGSGDGRKERESERGDVQLISPHFQSPSTHALNSRTAVRPSAQPLGRNIADTAPVCRTNHQPPQPQHHHPHPPSGDHSSIHPSQPLTRRHHQITGASRSDLNERPRRTKVECSGNGCSSLATLLSAVRHPQLLVSSRERCL